MKKLHIIALTIMLLTASCGLAAAAMNTDEFLDLCANGTPQQIEAAIEAGADANSKHSDGWPALMHAARANKNPEVLITLIQGGADINAKNDNGSTALMVAASFVDDPGIISELIQAGADINAQNKNGSTALMFAIQDNENPEVLNALIQAGVDVNAKNNDGATALMAAALHGKAPEVFNALIKGGADVNTKTNNGSTVLMITASVNNNPEALGVLIKAGADINAQDNLYGWSALMLAIMDNKNHEVLKALIQAGADVNAKNSDGETPLNLAMMMKEPEIVSLLLAAGADVSENDVELAQKNERLKDTAIIEELKKRVTAVSDSAPDAKPWFGLWRNAGHNGVSLYYLSADGKLEFRTFYINGENDAVMTGKYHVIGDKIYVTDCTYKGQKSGNFEFSFTINGDTMFFDIEPCKRVPENDAAAVLANPTALYNPGGIDEAAEFYTLGSDKISSVMKVVGKRNIVNYNAVSADGGMSMGVVYWTDPADPAQAANDVAKYFQYLIANDGFLSLKAFSGLPYEGGVEMQFAKDSVDAGNIITLDIDYNKKGYMLSFKKFQGKLTRN